MMRHNIALGVLAAALAACAPPEPKDASVIGEPLERALERAEAVQDTLNEHSEALRRELEEAQGNARRRN